MDPSLSRRSRLLLPALLVAAVGFTGCYTELAVVDRPYERAVDYVEVEEYEEDGDRVVSRYYYEDEYEPYRYRRYFDRFHFGVSFHHGPWFHAGAFGPRYYYDYYDPFWDPWYPVSWHWNPWPRYHWNWYSPYRYHHYAYVPGHMYTYAPYYSGWRYDAPYTIRRGNYAPRGRTIGRSRLADNDRSIDRGRGDAIRGSTAGRSGVFGSEPYGRDRGVTRGGGSAGKSEGVTRGQTRSGDRTVGSGTRSTARGTVGRSTGRTTTRGSSGVRSGSSRSGGRSSGTVRDTGRSRSSGSSGSVGRSSSGSSRSSGSVGRSSSRSSGR